MAEYGQLLWSCTNFRCSDRTLRSRDRFLTFFLPGNSENVGARGEFDKARIFWQVVRVQQPVQYGRDAAHISWAAWVFRSLEDYMHERQHHLNESSSARLGGSQQLEILPSPNSKQTQSLGIWFSDGRMAWAPRFLISAVIFIRRREFNVRLVSSVYYVAQQFYNSTQLWRL